MKKITIAFDVDGVLRDNTTSEDIWTANEDMIDLLRILSKFKNVRLVVWSSRGEGYARACIDNFDLNKYVKFARLKTWHCDKTPEDNFWPDIAIDDQHAFDGALLNLIARNK